MSELNSTLTSEQAATKLAIQVIDRDRRLFEADAKLKRLAEMHLALQSQLNQARNLIGAVRPVIAAIARCDPHRADPAQARDWLTASQAAGLIPRKDGSYAEVKLVGEKPG